MARNEVVCPLASVHSRLHSAHRLWHQAEQEYGDPEGFRTNLNACIQELRNITFVLQKSKHFVPEFDEWYGMWRDRMRADRVLGWLIDARNRIVKEGDLETESRLRVAMVDSYSDPPGVEIALNCLWLPAQVVDYFRAKELPEQLRQRGLLRLERRWIASDLPNLELLDVLAHCYGVLSNLADDAHRRGCPIGC